MVKITLEGMKHAVMQAFTNQTIKWDEDVQKALESAVANFDMREYITNVATTELRERAQATVRDAVSQAFWSDDQFRNEMVKLVRVALLDKMRPATEAHSQECPCNTCKEQREGWVCEGQPTIEKNEKKAKDLKMLIQYLRAKEEAGQMPVKDFPSAFWALVGDLEEAE
jgi:hypothetical protein